MEFTFTLTYRLAEPDSDPDRMIELLGAGAWEGARVGIGLPGRMVLEFTRAARSARRALRSALADVKREVPSARLVEASPDFVGLTEIAGTLCVSRQYMRKLMLAHYGTFPAPVHEGSVSIWHLAEVLAWLNDEAGYESERRLRDLALATMEVNVVRDVQRLRAVPARALQRLVA